MFVEWGPFHASSDVLLSSLFHLSSPYRRILAPSSPFPPDDFKMSCKPVAYQFYNIKFLTQADGISSAFIKKQ